jgi:D-sedoheptulose 7-phosphate isomerase
MYQKIVDELLDAHIQAAVDSRENLLQTVPTMAAIISDAFKSGNKLLICGNGGSAADSQHLAAEFVSAFSKEISRRGLPAIALTVDTSILTAYANDFGFEGVFSRQIEALGSKNDVLLVLTTSGNSKNCLVAVDQAKSMGMKTLGFSGNDGKLKSKVDVCLCINSSNTQHIQEIHQLAYHALVGLVENQMI